MSYKLITETIDITQSDIKYLDEDVNGTQKHKFKGILLQDSTLNGNKRIYPKEVMQQAVKEYNDKFITTGRALGELGHPETGAKLNLHLVSHKITSIQENGNNWIGEAELLDTPNGRIASSLMKAGVVLGSSSRGMGDFKRNKNGHDEILPGFKFATVSDLVADPSAPSAFVRGVMENVEYTFDENTLEWIETNIKLPLKKMTLTQIEEAKLLLFNQFLTKISGK